MMPAPGAVVAAATARPPCSIAMSLVRQLRYGDANGTVGFRDHAQCLGIELDPGKAQTGDRRFDVDAVSAFAEVGDGFLDALARVGGKRHQVEHRIVRQRLFQIRHRRLCRRAEQAKGCLRTRCRERRR